MKREITTVSDRPAAEEREDSAQRSVKRRYPIGAEVVGPGEAHFRVWAPKASRLDVVWQESAHGHGSSSSHSLGSEGDGYFCGTVQCEVGALYKFRLDGAATSYPDPASRSQPAGPHGASCLVDPSLFPWTDSAWRGIRLPGQIIYEFHVGTFTPEGTWSSATTKLELLKESGITLLEMMPIADFGGNFGWGYDGVNLFAPTRLYGNPDDLRAFIDRAHQLGLGVILDVVYNHFGPDGNYLSCFSDDYLQHDRANEWGDAINFDGKNSAGVREFFITNARYWIEEFHFDGFRFDATQSIFDESGEYIVGVIADAARTAAGGRDIVLVAENEPQETKLVRSREEGGDGLDGLWNDDFHHSAMVALTGRTEAYYTDYKGTPQEFVSAAKYGYLYQGQPYEWQEAPRGHSAFGIPPEAFVAFIENHDQVSNSAMGRRVIHETSPGRYRAMTALLLLGPWTPLLFQGEEFGSSSPFVYFCDVGDEKLKGAVRKGRFEFLAQFPSIASEEVQRKIPIPHALATFQQSKVNWEERHTNKEWHDLHRDLIRLRREDSRFRLQIPRGVDGAVLHDYCWLLRFFGEKNDDRLLMVNLGPSLRLVPIAEPLLAPPEDFQWQILWSSEAPKYGGPGVVPIALDQEWAIPAEATVAFHPQRRTEPRPKPKKK